MASCYDQGDCIFTSSDLVRFDFVSIKSPTTAVPLYVDSIIIPGKRIFKPDTIELASSYVVPIDPNESETRFVFFWANRIDTLVLSYTMQSQVLGPDCGTFSYVNDLALKYNTFNTVLIPNPQLRVDFKTKTPIQNVQILL